MGPLAQDPVGREDRVVTIKVGTVTEPGLFRHFAYTDLTICGKTEAERQLLERARKSVDPDYRVKPATPARLSR